MVENALRIVHEVIECPIDYSVNYETFSKEIEDFTCKM